MSGFDWKAASQELEVAVRLLMIPHAAEERALNAARNKFEHAFPEGGRTGDPRADEWVEKIRGAWDRAESGGLSEDGKYEFSRLLWELSRHADRKVWRRKKGQG